MREGTGIVATVETLINRKPGSGAREFAGSGIQGGVERTIGPGDLVFIPPGVPHGIKQSTSIT